MGNICTIFSQAKSKLYLSYINTYAPLACKHQKTYKIPASITLAQGLLESDAGTSKLALKSNNHFGIKCHGCKRGFVRHTDDKRNERFRKYKTIEESYKDHALLLSNSSRYAPLFKLKITDYKGWATGLKKAGYATSRTYATRLINIIELYELYKYDKEEVSPKKAVKPVPKKEEFPPFIDKEEGVYPIALLNELECVSARGGDNLSDIANSVHIDATKLAEYNEVPLTYAPQKGEPIFLEKKKKKSYGENKTHIVKKGESMHSISQKYGIQVAYLYKKNKLTEDYTPKPNDVLKLR